LFQQHISQKQKRLQKTWRILYQSSSYILIKKRISKYSVRKTPKKLETNLWKNITCPNEF
jgi:hypothetical protein